MYTPAFLTAFGISFVVTMGTAWFALQSLFPEGSHTISSAKALLVLVVLVLVNLVPGVLSGLVSGVLFTFDELYSPIAGMYAGGMSAGMSAWLALLLHAIVSKRHHRS